MDLCDFFGTLPFNGAVEVFRHDASTSPIDVKSEPVVVGIEQALLRNLQHV